MNASQWAERLRDHPVSDVLCATAYKEAERHASQWPADQQHLAQIAFSEGYTRSAYAALRRWADHAAELLKAADVRYAQLATQLAADKEGGEANGR